MEPAQPADRVPADQTPPDGQPPVGPTDPPARPDGEPALVDPTAETEPVDPGGRDDPDVTAARILEHDVPPARTGAVPAAPKGKARAERSPKDMALSLLVLLVPIALLLAFYRGFLGGDQPTVVDPAPAYEQARAANVFPVSEPRGLGEGWRTVSANFRSVEGGSNLRIGYLTPEGQAAQLVQSNVPPERLLPAELTREGQPQGPVDLGGRSWQRYTARGNEQALVLLEPGRTVIVVGDARENELRQLAGSLR
ncbi:DUF4245 family protein [Micromonospora sp. PLK6-60]|uniref:DUF4245 domain-containing protein n=1 Tax=Micromonospora sp. PLK6-60 TaxID=2873383 RepID=UPI001CA703CD|nr:DUF4245 domain-containing protein [Micromonospora sp. PLK6-60]MBY8872078.1 DUF4245 family protein [Micromonospora sp. PLK6-60]